MNLPTVILTNRDGERDCEDAIARTEQPEVAMEMVRLGLAKRLVIASGWLSQSKTEALRQFVAEFYPDCEVRSDGERKQVANDPSGAVSPRVTASTGTTHVYIVYSLKGGAGCTTIACNLAVCLASVRSGVILLDFSRPVGDVVLHFDLPPGPTVIDCLPYVDADSPSLPTGSLVEWGTRLSVLRGIADPRHGQLVDAGQWERLLEVAVSRTHTVVVDVGCQPEMVDVLTEAAGTGATRVVVAGPDLSSLVRLRRHIVDAGDSMPRVVINAWHDQGVGPQEMSRLTADAPYVRIEQEAMVPHSIIEGMPLAARMPRCKFTTAVLGLLGLPVPSAERSRGPETWTDKLLRMVKR